MHFAEQRAAPYSMKSARHKRYTVDNNVNATQQPRHRGGGDRSGCAHRAPGHDGRVRIRRRADDARGLRARPGGGRRTAPEDVREILHPTDPGSVYHLTKSIDQLVFAYFNKNDAIRVTDLHQGIVWGTQTQETGRDERLVNRFDYDGDYGTVLNRFLMQAAIGLSADRAWHRRADPRVHPHPGHGALHRARDRAPAAGGRAGAHLQPDDGGAPRHRSRRAGRARDRRADRARRQPAQGGARERAGGGELAACSTWGSTRSGSRTTCCTRSRRSRCATATAATSTRSRAVRAGCSSRRCSAGFDEPARGGSSPRPASCRSRAPEHRPESAPARRGCDTRT